MAYRTALNQDDDFRQEYRQLYEKLATPVTDEGGVERYAIDRNRFDGSDSKVGAFADRWRLRPAQLIESLLWSDESRQEGDAIHFSYLPEATLPTDAVGQVEVRFAYDPVRMTREGARRIAWRKMRPQIEAIEREARERELLPVEEQQLDPQNRVRMARRVVLRRKGRTLSEIAAADGVDVSSVRDSVVRWTKLLSL